MQDQKSSQPACHVRRQCGHGNLGNRPCTLSRCGIQWRGARQRRLPVQIGRSANQEWHQIKQEFEEVKLVWYHRTVFARGLWRARRLSTSPHSMLALPCHVPYPARTASPQPQEQKKRSLEEHSTQKFVRDGAKMGNAPGSPLIYTPQSPQRRRSFDWRDSQRRLFCFTGLPITATMTLLISYIIA